MSALVPTDDITVLSSPHGRKRRRQRRISKRDLQAAIKHGEKLPANPAPDGSLRWKYIHNDVVYITNESSRKEVTSWSLQTQSPSRVKARIQRLAVDQVAHSSKLQLVKSTPTRVSSHTVLVVDMSGSMRRLDMGDHRTRAQFVYQTLAQKLVKAQLEANTNPSLLDVVSLVEMRDDAEVVFEAEPLDANLFNCLLERCDRRPSSHGNYVPALQCAAELLGKFSHGGCAMLLLFLSDGKPSDRNPKGWAKQGPAFAGVMEQVAAMTRAYGRRLTVGTIGFADEQEDFDVLQRMAHAAKAFSQSSYQHARADLGAAVTSLVSSITSTKIELTAADGLARRTVRSVTRELPTLSSPVSGQWAARDVWYYPYVERFRWNVDAKEWDRVQMLNPRSNSLVIRQAIFGEGAERVVYAMREAHIDDTDDPCKELLGEHLVAKESRFIEDMCDHGMTRSSVLRFQLSTECFHQAFCRTQQLAQGIALAFNERLDGVLGSRAATMKVPHVLFLDCFVYLAREFDYKSSTFKFREVLAERRLHNARYQKWNSNAGMEPKGEQADQTGSPPASVDAEAKTREVEPRSASAAELGKRKREGEAAAGGEIEAEDVPQAFSHFSFEHSQQTMLVCDLQGVFSEAAKVFELTDPVIHHADTNPKPHTAGKPGAHSGSFGRTDKGKKGMEQFFETHICNPVCLLLGLTPHPMRCEVNLPPSRVSSWGE